MKTLYKTCLMAGTMLCVLPVNANAQTQNCHNQEHNHSVPTNIMGDHTHNKGEWMISYNASKMHMQGNLSGSNSISPETIVTTISNPNAPPATLRVVPTKMDMNMHMFGAMYGLTDKVTLMAMAMYAQKNMDHITFAGMAGTTVLGNFTTNSSGFGDSSLRAIYNIHNAPNHKVNLSLGISAPTGSIKEEDNVLTPTGAISRLRLPYAMQLGSGTWDALAGLTYTGHKGKVSWGAQYQATLRLEDENSQGYQLGDKHILTGWGGYKLSKELSGNIFTSYEKQGKIKGSDALITAPVQTANPDNYGGDIIEIGAGFSYKPDFYKIKGIELKTQISAPIYQDLNGVQMDRNWSIATRISYKF